MDARPSTSSVPCPPGPIRSLHCRQGWPCTVPSTRGTSHQFVPKVKLATWLWHGCCCRLQQIQIVLITLGTLH